jgi:methylmalonyl-CoA mutase, N-terminal domain
LGGSYFIEALTDEMEQEIVGVMNELEEYGGMVKAVEDGFVQRMLAEGAYSLQQKIESGEKVIVGVNKFRTEEEAAHVESYAMSPGDRRHQLDRLAQIKRQRDGSEVARLLDLVKQAAIGTENLMPYLIDAVKAYCTVGEITDALRDTWGEFRQPAF